MNYLSVIKELDSLPKGYISIKKINGKERHYLQYKENGKVISRYIKDEEYDQILSQLKRKQELEQQLKDLKTSLLKREIRPLSNNAVSLTGDLMEGNDIIASFVNGNLTHMDKKRVPLYIARTRDIKGWLENRCLDMARIHSKLLLKALGITATDPYLIVLHDYAQSIIDDFWFRPYKSNKSYDEIKFADDIYSELALNGNTEHLFSKAYMTPELTNNGSFEKCWKHIDNHWRLYKHGNTDQLFAEWFSSALALKLNIPTAKYEIKEDIIFCNNLTEEYNLEPMSSVAGEDNSYENVFQAIRKTVSRLLPDYLLLMWFDCLTYNVDRHNENMGFLRDRKTGDIVSLAPNYDNNQALFANGMPDDLSRKKDGRIKLFYQFLSSNEEAREGFLSLDLPHLDKDMIDEILKDRPFDYDSDSVRKFIYKGYKRLKEMRQNLKEI